MVKVKSNRGLKFAIELVDALMAFLFSTPSDIKDCSCFVSLRGSKMLISFLFVGAVDVTEEVLALLLTEVLLLICEVVIFELL